MEAVIASRKGDLTTVERNTEKLVSMADRCCNDENLPNELLYGRAGYLFALLYLQKYINAGVIDDGIILKVSEGVKSSKQSRIGRIFKCKQVINAEVEVWT